MGHFALLRYTNTRMRSRHSAFDFAGNVRYCWTAGDYATTGRRDFFHITVAAAASPSASEKWKRIARGPIYDEARWRDEKTAADSHGLRGNEYVKSETPADTAM